MVAGSVAVMAGVVAVVVFGMLLGLQAPLAGLPLVVGIELDHIELPAVLVAQVPVGHMDYTVDLLAACRHTPLGGPH